MQRPYLLALATVAGVALLSAQQGPACPYQDAERAAVASSDIPTTSDGTPGGGSILSLGRSAVFAP